MKNKAKVIIITAAVLFAVASCEKDGNGNRVKYYKHLTGEGYVFYRYLDGTIAPFPNGKVEIIASSGGKDAIGTSQTVQTDKNGFYKGVRFAETVNRKIMMEYSFLVTVNDDGFQQIFSNHKLSFDAVKQVIETAKRRNPHVIVKDTLFVEQVQVY